MSTVTVDTHKTGSRSPETASRGLSTQAVVRVDHEAGDRFDIAVRGHRITVDQPQNAGGDDAGPTPTELFVASLASCVAFYARRYCARHEIDPDGLAVEASYELGAKPARVTDIRISLRVPPALPESRRDALLAVAGHCTVHNSITTPPAITLDLVDQDAARRSPAGPVREQP